MELVEVDRSLASFLTEKRKKRKRKKELALFVRRAVRYDIQCPLRERVLRRLRTAAASSSRTVTVSCQPMHASVMLTPYFRPVLPSGGTFWLP